MADKFRPVIDRLLDEADRLRVDEENSGPNELFAAFVQSYLFDADAEVFASTCDILADVADEKSDASEKQEEGDEWEARCDNLRAIAERVRIVDRW